MINNNLVLSMLKKNPKGLTAYEILNRVQKFKFIQPMTIYRALDKLKSEGKIHKSNRNKTFHICNDQDHREHNAVLAVCDNCGVAEELKVTSFLKIIRPLKTKNKFNFKKFNLEITTNCKECN